MSFNIIAFLLFMVIILVVAKIMSETSISLEEDEVNSSEKWMRSGLLLAFLALLLPFFIQALLGWNFSLKFFKDLGTIGDFFGGTTVGLLSFASSLLFVSTIMMQREELKMQRKELRLQREELKLTREEFKIGNTTAKVQQIDNAFFNMLELHNQIVNNIKINSGSGFNETIIGREAIAKLKYIFEEKYFNTHLLDTGEILNTSWIELSDIDKIHKRRSFFSKENSVDQERLNKVYKEFHKVNGDTIGHYMRNTYRIVKFIVENIAFDENDQSIIQEKTKRTPIIADKKYYFGMLRAQWSSSEFEMILINSLYEENHKFKKLILDYDVLDIKAAGVPEGNFLIKDSFSTFKAYRNLIEIK